VSAVRRSVGAAAVLGIDLSWIVRGARGDAGAVAIQLSYDFIDYHYPMLDEAPTIGHMVVVDLSLAR
jgi:hypothetical protein